MAKTHGWLALGGLENPVAKPKRRRRRKRRRTRWGNVGDVVTGRTRDGRPWKALVGLSGRLVGKVVG